MIHGTDELQVNLYRMERIMAGIKSQPMVLQASNAIEVLTLNTKVLNALVLRLQALEGGGNGKHG